MKLDYVPLLKIQRELHDIPRGRERFLEYLRAIGANDGSAMLELPSLIIMNPMGREHVATLLEEYLALDGDVIANRAVKEAAAHLREEPGDFKVTVVIADDLKGGWTNRYDYEFTQRFQCGPPDPRDPKLPRWVTHYWVNGILWTSEPASERAVREAVLTAIYRTAYVQRHGSARTLEAM